LWCFPCNRNLYGEGIKFEVADELKPKEEATPNPEYETPAKPKGNDDDNLTQG